ncbi:MAG: hypothetical protein EYC70_00390 [Planctomycetota bacterium]|nr:MAG: hypothetical protein EYC70_00390 [Planctomycetota bacterium]
MTVTEDVYFSYLDPGGRRFRLRKDQANGLVVPVAALVDEAGNLVDDEGLLARALPTTTTPIVCVAAPAAGFRIRLHALLFGNVDSAVKVSAVRWGSGGADFISVAAAANNGFQAVYFDPKLIKGPEATALYARLSAGTAGANTVSVDALYSIAPI